MPSCSSLEARPGWCALAAPSMRPARGTPGVFPVTIIKLRPGFFNRRSQDAGPISEGHSYWAVARAFGWFGETLVAPRRVLPSRSPSWAITAPETVLPSLAAQRPAFSFSNLTSEGRHIRGTFRAVTEEYARDSYENLLFSLCRFHELTGGWRVASPSASRSQSSPF